jgi:hypothetical protein
MSFDVTTKIRLQRLEHDLKTAIQQGEYPFLGHYSDLFYDLVENAISQALRGTNYPLNLYFKSMQTWPAVFSIYLVHHISEGYGSRGTFEVYPFIQDALHTQLTLGEKEKLWEAFRSAILKLGLSRSTRRSGSNYMIEEYLRQAGVPLGYLDELAKKMYSYSESVGLPEDDDPDAINLWQAGLRYHIRYMSKPVQRSIEADSDGFYTRLFLKVFAARSGQNELTCEVEKLLSGGLKDVSRRSNGKALSIPKIVFRDGQLGVDLPAGEDAVWRIEYGDTHNDYLGQLEARFVPFDDALPKSVSIRNLKGASSVSADLWDDSLNNRLLLFSESGLLVGKGQLGQVEALLLEPGEYELLLRFEPSNPELSIERIADDPKLYHCHLSLDPSQFVELKRGPAKITFRADTKPVLVWNGQKFRGIQGNELYASDGLSIEAKIPEDLLTDESLNYVLHINPGFLGEPIQILLAKDGGNVRISLADHCALWQPGVTRLLIELKRSGFQRAEARAVINLWNGLKEVRNRSRFICSRLPTPTNLLESDCDNIRIDQEQKVITFRNEDQRFFRMVFQAHSSRKQAFTWSVPGIFLNLLNFQEQERTETPLKRESTLAITTRSREVLEIFSSENGTITLGDFSRYVDFDRTGRVRIPLAGLVEYLGPGDDALKFIGSESHVKDRLIRFVAPHQVLEFRPRLKRDKYVLTFSTKNEVEEVSIDIKDLITGWKETLIIGCHSAEIYSEGSFSAYLSSMPNNGDNTHSHELQLFLDNWPNGAWLLALNGKINGRWGRFSNTRNDHFEVGLPVVNNVGCQSSEICWDFIKNLTITEKETILKRVHRKLLNCYAPEAWEELNWLGDLWNKLTDDFQKQETLPQRITTLAEERHDDTSSDSWLPMFSLVSKFPKLYSQNGRAYRNLPNQRQLLSIKCLAVMGELKYGVLPLIFDQTLNNMLGGAFSNLAEMQQGLSPKDFSLERYQASLKLEDVSEKLRLLRQHEWQPGDGDYLGALHYRFATEQLSQAFHASMSGNKYRRGKALALCRALNIIPLQGVPSHLMVGPGVIDLSTGIYDEEYRPSVEEDHLKDIIRFLSQYARACRWEIRVPGTLEQIQQKACQHLGSKEDFDLVLCYLLLLGKDVFMFYLLLWESAFKTDVDHLGGKIYVRK